MHPNRKPTRLAGYDYSCENAYFITSVVKGRKNIFGEVLDRKVSLNEFGMIANDQMIWLKNQYTYIKIPVWIIMPNHVHAIIEITISNPICRCKSRPTSTNELKIKSLSELMGAYKTTSSKLIHLAGLPEFQWQRSFHDRIIRNQYEYQNIYNYIVNNPMNRNK